MSEFKFSFDLNKSEEKDGKRFIYGIASTESVDSAGDVLEASGLKKSAEWYLQNGIVDYDHQSQVQKDPSFIIGRPVNLTWDADNRAHFKAELFKGVKKADAIWDLVQAKAHLGFSVGGKILDQQNTYDPKLNKNVNRIKKVFLNHIAVTPFPANGDTACVGEPFSSFMKNLEGGASDMDFSIIEAEELLKIQKLLKGLTATGNDASASPEEATGGVKDGGNVLMRQSLDARIKKKVVPGVQEQDNDEEEEELTKAEKSESNKLVGGKADGKTPKDFDKEQLKIGIKIEMEHTKDKEIAAEIAMDHLEENPRYYDNKMFKEELKKESKGELMKTGNFTVQIVDDTILIKNTAGVEVIQDKELTRKTEEDKMQIVSVYADMLKAMHEGNKDTQDVDSYLIATGLDRNSRRLLKRHLLKKVSEVLSEDSLVKSIIEPTFNGAKKTAFELNGATYGKDEFPVNIPQQAASTATEVQIQSAIRNDNEVQEYLSEQMNSATAEDIRYLDERLASMEYEAMSDDEKFTRYNEIRGVYGRAPLDRKQFNLVNKNDSYAIVSAIKSFDKLIQARLDENLIRIGRELMSQMATSKVINPMDNQHVANIKDVCNSPSDMYN